MSPQALGNCDGHLSLFSDVLTKKHLLWKEIVLPFSNAVSVTTKIAFMVAERQIKPKLSA